MPVGRHRKSGCISGGEKSLKAARSAKLRSIRDFEADCYLKTTALSTMCKIAILDRFLSHANEHQTHLTSPRGGATMRAPGPPACLASFSAPAEVNGFWISRNKTSISCRGVDRQMTVRAQNARGGSFRPAAPILGGLFCSRNQCDLAIGSVL